MIKYAVYPGHVRSVNDDDTHFISFTQLCRLYGVNREECVNMHDTYKRMGVDTTNLTKLYPRSDGDYRLPDDKSETDTP